MTVLVEFRNILRFGKPPHEPEGGHDVLEEMLPWDRERYSGADADKTTKHLSWSLANRLEECISDSTNTLSTTVNMVLLRPSKRSEHSPRISSSKSSMHQTQRLTAYRRPQYPGLYLIIFLMISYIRM